MTVTLREFAETILLSGSFEQKLISPDAFLDAGAAAPFSCPDTPTRNQTLRFHQDASGHARLTFPSASSLKLESARAKVFHAFANHELLAMEIMALAILKFPNTPKEFRLGVASCIKEEQSHLKLYLQRMQELGVAFGDFPVNGFFWNVMKEMKHPLEFIASMSMTFEQANLDFSHYYLNCFRKIEDDASAKIMDRVFREEVGHVKFGVQWFEKMRPPAESQWESYCKFLTLPLTPERAKGTYFAAAHREGTQLDKEYLEKLEAYTHSRGRPPRVFRFNSNCELEWAASFKKQSTFQAPKSQEELSADFASLMMFLGHREDIVALATPPSLAMIRQWREWGFLTPNFVVYSKEQPEALVRELTNFKVQSFEPWGWSPIIAEELKKYQGSLLRQDAEWPPFNENHWKKLSPCYSKTSALERLSLVVQQHPEWSESIVLPEHVGKRCDSVSDVLTEVAKQLASSCGPVVLKAPLGSSGFNMIRILSLPLEPQQMGWIKNTLGVQGSLIVEPWLERIADFSIQIEVNSFAAEKTQKGRVLGLTRMLSDHRGQYLGHQLGGKTDDLSENVRKLCYQTDQNPFSFFRILEDCALEVSQWLQEQGFRGAAGIDAFIYFCKQTGRFRIKPVSEINARFTMGRIALRLEEHLSTGSSGLWVHISRQKLAKLGHQDWFSWIDSLKESFPNEFVQPTESGGMVRLKSGVFPTNDPQTAKSFLSVLLVHRDISTLRQVTLG